MSTAKIIEISSDSRESFEDAIKQGIEKAARSVDDIRGAWVSEQKVYVENGKVATYRVNMRVSFVLH